MPRRKKPLQTAVAGATVRLGQDAGLTTLTGQFLRESAATGQLGDAARDCMAGRIVDAYRRAQLDIGIVASGKSAKPDAWRLDLFCFDIAEAWREAGMEPTVWENARGRSPFTAFVNSLATMLDLDLGRGSLVNNAKRALDMERL